MPEGQNTDENNSSNPAAEETVAATEKAATTEAAVTEAALTEVPVAEVPVAPEPVATEAQSAPAAAEPAVTAEPAPAAEPAEARAPGARPKGTLQELFDAGAHFGHQTWRWNPQIKPYIYGARSGVHIIDLDKSVRLLHHALAFLRELTARGGRLLWVSTKRQAQATVKAEAQRSEQFYVNNRWLGGMLTNFRTVRRSIDLFKSKLETRGDPQQVAELSKKDLSRLNRDIARYKKSLDGLREMERLPDALFIIDLNKEHIALAEARRLGIPVVAVVDTNCSPEGVDYVIPGNDDAVRAIQLYCALVADACLEGARRHQEKLQSDAPAPGKTQAATGGRRVVEIHPQPGGSGRGERSRGGRGRRGSRGGDRQAGGAFSAGGPEEAGKREGGGGRGPGKRDGSGGPGKRDGGRGRGPGGSGPGGKRESGKREGGGRAKESAPGKTPSPQPPQQN